MDLLPQKSNVWTSGKKYLESGNSGTQKFFIHISLPSVIPQNSVEIIIIIIVIPQNSDES